MSPEHRSVASVRGGERAAGAAAEPGGDQLLLYGSGAPNLAAEDGDPVRQAGGMPNGPGERVLDHRLDVPANVNTTRHMFSFFDPLTNYKISQ